MAWAVLANEMAMEMGAVPSTDRTKRKECARAEAGRLADNSFRFLIETRCQDGAETSGKVDTLPRHRFPLAVGSCELGPIGTTGDDWELQVLGSRAKLGTWAKNLR